MQSALSARRKPCAEYATWCCFGERYQHRSTCVSPALYGRNRPLTCTLLSMSMYACLYILPYLRACTSLTQFLYFPPHALAMASSLIWFDHCKVMLCCISRDKVIVLLNIHVCLEWLANKISSSVQHRCDEMLQA